MDSSVLPPDNPDKGLTDCLTTVSGIGWRACLKRGSVRYIVTRTINIPKGRGNRWKLLPRVQITFSQMSYHFSVERRLD